jgi:hypothetical protein
MCPEIDNPASCEIRAVIRFLHAKNMSSAEIHRVLCTVYGQNITSEVTVKQWYRMFKDGRKNVQGGERSGLSSVVSDDLVQSVDKKNYERPCFTISGRSCEFPSISRTLLCDIITVGLTSAHKMQRMPSALIFRNYFLLTGSQLGQQWIQPLIRVRGIKTERL